eukprot:2722780-Pleurochrysis_carterae.AAC.2
MEQGLAKKGDTVVFAYGWQHGVASLTNFRMVTVGTELKHATDIPPPTLLELCDFSQYAHDVGMSSEGVVISAPGSPKRKKASRCALSHASSA